MNDKNNKDLAHKAWVLYRLARDMQRTMLDMFLNEFIDLDEEEEKLRIQMQELPF